VDTSSTRSGDRWNSSYLIIWGTNLPITRTPDAHIMTEARYRGQNVVVVSPDYSDHTKFADDWLPAHRTRGLCALTAALAGFWVRAPVLTRASPAGSAG
jgi:nitrate reductase alpha subunit